MSELQQPISRRSIEMSDQTQIYWADAYLALAAGPLRTRAYEEEYRNGTMSAPEDAIVDELYVSLMAASTGGLAIPEDLGADQIEDWFIGKAVLEGLAFYDEILELKAKIN